jgi:ABC-type polysaccharide/polyol phosphate export permease
MLLLSELLIILNIFGLFYVPGALFSLTQLFIFFILGLLCLFCVILEVVFSRVTKRYPDFLFGFFAKGLPFFYT